jgi:hypothetical protein
MMDDVVPRGELMRSACGVSRGAVTKLQAETLPPAHAKRYWNQYRLDFRRSYGENRKMLPHANY